LETLYARYTAAHIDASGLPRHSPVEADRAAPVLSRRLRLHVLGWVSADEVADEENSLVVAVALVVLGLNGSVTEAQKSDRPVEGRRRTTLAPAIIPT
jgi:hypothetical protein